MPDYDQRGAHRDGKDADLLAEVDQYELLNTPGHLIRRSQQRAVDLYFEEVGENSLTPRQFALLLTVGQNPGLIQTDLVNLSGIDRSTVADMVRRLVKRGLLESRRIARDRRCKALWITGPGQQAVLEAYQCSLRVQDRILAPLPPEHRGAFVRYLRLVAGLPEEGSRARRPAAADGGHSNPRPARKIDAGAAELKSREPALND